MTEIQARPLTREAFRRYGDFVDLFSPEGFALGNFYPDQIAFTLDGGLPAGVGVCRLVRTDEMLVDMVEYHNDTCEGVLCLDADMVIFAGNSVGDFPPAALEAFVVPKGTFVRLDPGVLHGGQFPLGVQQATALVFLPQRTYARDMHCTVLQGDERVRITV